MGIIPTSSSAPQDVSLTLWALGKYLITECLTRCVKGPWMKPFTCSDAIHGLTVGWPPQAS